MVLCEPDVDECSSGACQNNATCVDMVDGYQCQCESAYTGTLCETGTSSPILYLLLIYYYDMFFSFLFYYNTDIDECESSPCQYNGTCHDEVGYFACDCVLGYTGDQCQTGWQHLKVQLP